METDLESNNNSEPENVQKSVNRPKLEIDQRSEHGYENVPIPLYSNAVSETDNHKAIDMWKLMNTESGQEPGKELELSQDILMGNKTDAEPNAQWGNCYWPCELTAMDTD